MTLKEKVICTAYTGISFVQGEELDEFYKYIEDLFKRPVYTHELAEDEAWSTLKELSKEDFLKVCAGEMEDGK